MNKKTMNELTTLRKKALSMIEAPNATVYFRRIIKYVIDNGHLFNVINAKKNVLEANIKYCSNNSDDWCNYINNLGIKDSGVIYLAMSLIYNDVPVSITDRIFNYA